MNVQRVIGRLVVDYGIVAKAESIREPTCAVDFKFQRTVCIYS